MKLKHFVFCLFILLPFTNCYLQTLDYGLVIESNLATHTNRDPTIPEDGQFQWDRLNTFGIGIYSSRLFLNKLYLTSSLVFRQRGYTEHAQIISLCLPTLNLSLQNRLNYISLDLKGKYVRNTNHKLKFSPIIGISTNLLASTNNESEDITPISSVYPVDQYRSNWKSINLNYIFGISLFQLNKYSLDVEFNRSITPVLKTETLLVKDWVWSAKLNLSLQHLLK